MLTEDVFTHASIEPSSHHRGGIEAEHRSCIEPRIEPRIELSASSIEAGAQRRICLLCRDPCGLRRALGYLRLCLAVDIIESHRAPASIDAYPASLGLLLLAHLPWLKEANLGG